jgi:hypothetical protein
MRCHYTLPRRAVIKEMPSVGEDVEKQKPSCIAGVNVSGITTLKDSLSVSLKS